MFDSRWLKIIAIVLMTVDHVGGFLLPEGSASYTVLRAIGRLAYPLFAFIIAYGCTKTRNISMYFLRLIAFAVVLQTLWAIAGFVYSDLTPYFNNIFFTLAFGVLAIWIIKYMRRNAPVKNGTDLAVFAFFACVFTLVICVGADFLQVDYGGAGVLLIVMFFVMFQVVPYGAEQNSTGGTKHHESKDWILCIAVPIVILVIFNTILFLLRNWEIQWYSMLAAPLIWLFRPRKLKIHWLEKYFFYIYYPLHIAILCAISVLV